jgi:hypothetical protein
MESQFFEFAKLTGEKLAKQFGTHRYLLKSKMIPLEIGSGNFFSFISLEVLIALSVCI